MHLFRLTFWRCLSQNRVIQWITSRVLMGRDYYGNKDNSSKSYSVLKLMPTTCKSMGYKKTAICKSKCKTVVIGVLGDMVSHWRHILLPWAGACAFVWRSSSLWSASRVDKGLQRSEIFLQTIKDRFNARQPGVTRYRRWIIHKVLLPPS